MSQISNMPPRSGTAPPPRAGTAPPRPGVPAGLQSAIQRREASQPLPNRAMNGSVPPMQQRSVTAPPQQQDWNAPQDWNASAQSYTPSNVGEQNYGSAARSFTPAQGRYTPANRSYTPAGPPGRSFTPAQRSYTPADRSFTPASTGYAPSNQRGYNNDYQY
jgi:hypothetical protein